jgi:hypothetical protein
MCFSAEASFAGGIIISAIGIATVTKIHKPSQLVFASIPLFFGVQQFTEGVLWLTLPNPELIGIQKVSTYLFLIMAEVLWPMMIPLSVLFMEENRKRKRYLQIFLMFGICISVYYAARLILFKVNPEIMGYHIHYHTNTPQTFGLTTFLIYLSVTIVPLFISSIKKTHLLGALMFLSCAVTVVFFRQYLTSVWCFFAAIISGVIFWILRDSKRKFKFDKLEILKKKLAGFSP